MAKHNKKKLRSFLLILFSISLCGLLFGSLWLTKIIVDDVALIFGPSEESFSFYKKVIYSTKLYFSGEELLESQNNLKEDFYFEILPGESVGQISYRLSINNLIQNPEIFKDFLIYRGFDRKVQSGCFLRFKLEGHTNEKYAQKDTFINFFANSFVLLGR